MIIKARTILEQLLKKMGVDRAIFFVLVGRGFSFISQPVTMYLIAKYFTPSEQGYYYTFANVLSISIFLELGLGVVLTQFASHEFALLEWTSSGSLTGDAKALSRLLSMARKALKWYGIMSLLIIVVLVPAGLYFFGSNPVAPNIYYVLPWACLVVFSALNMVIYPIITIVEGCGKVAELHQMRLYQALFGAFFIWVVILSRGSLLAASILAASNLAVSAAWLHKNFNGLIRQILRSDEVLPTARVSWQTEILPMQWRIALSWMSGYLISQLFNPLLFRYQSPAVAGQMGMSMSVANIALTVSIAWISTKFPAYGALIQKKQYKELDNIALKSTLQALFFSIVLSITVLICVYLIKIYFPQYSSRVLSIYAIGALLFSNILLLIITSMAGYLRAHKAEPLLGVSILSALLTTMTAWVCARFYTAEMMTFSIAGINLLIGLPVTAYVFVKKRQEWHILPSNAPILKQG